MKFDAWPEEDKLLWTKSTSDQHILEDDYYASGWSDATRIGIRLAYGRWLAWIAMRQPSALHASPEKRVTSDAVVDYVTELRNSISDITIVGYLSQIRCALRAMVPNIEWQWLGTITDRIRRSSGPAKDKSKRVVTSNRLIELGMSLMSEAQVGHRMNIDNAVRFRDGFMIALLAARPLRTKNFMDIEIGKHLFKEGRAWWIRFQATETKNRAMVQFPLPNELNKKLDAYINVVRPFLAGQTGYKDKRFMFKKPKSRLWVSRSGSALSRKIFYATVMRRTESHFGHSVNPHLFRDCLATTLALHYTNHVRVTPIALGHRSQQTSQKHYNQVVGDAAAEHFQRHVQALRAKTRPVAQR